MLRNTNPISTSSHEEAHAAAARRVTSSRHPAKGADGSPASITAAQQGDSAGDALPCLGFMEQPAEGGLMLLRGSEGEESTTTMTTTTTQDGEGLGPYARLGSSNKLLDLAALNQDARYDDPRLDAYGPRLFAEVDPQGYKVWLAMGELGASDWTYAEPDLAGRLTVVRANGFAAKSWSDQDYEEMAGQRFASLRDRCPPERPTSRADELPRCKGTRARLSPTPADPFASLPRGTRRVPEEPSSSEPEARSRLLKVADAMRQAAEREKAALARLAEVDSRIDALLESTAMRAMTEEDAELEAERVACLEASFADPMPPEPSSSEPEARSHVFSDKAAPCLDDASHHDPEVALQLEDDGREARPEEEPPMENPVESPRDSAIDAARELGRLLERNDSPEWEERAGEWMDLWEPTMEWAEEARILMGEWESHGAPVGHPSDFPSAELLPEAPEGRLAFAASSGMLVLPPLAASVIASEGADRAEAGGVIGEPEAPPVTAGNDGEPPARGKEHDHGTADSSADLRPGNEAPPEEAGRDAQEQADGETETVDALRQPTYRSVGAEQREEVMAEKGVKVRIQLTSYEGGRYLSGAGDNYMVRGRTAPEVRAALRPLLDMARERHGRRKGGRRLRIQLTEQSERGSAYLKQDGEAPTAYNLSVPGMTAVDGSPLVDYLLAAGFGERRREAAVLAVAWRRFESMPLVETEGRPLKPEGGCLQEEAPCPDSGAPEKSPNGVQPEAAAAPLRAGDPANPGTALATKSQIPENTVQPSISDGYDPCREEVLAMCASLREAGHGKLADSLQNSGGRYKIGFYAEAAEVLN